jgi:GTP-binding protein YchF
MKLALVGLANCGKTTLFNAATGLTRETTPYPETSGETQIGVAKVFDERVAELSKIYKPKKTTFATVEYTDYLGFVSGDSKHNQEVLSFVRDSDALIHVIRTFNDDSVLHPLDSIDPIRDFETFQTELILADLDLCEKRLQRMEEGARRGKKFDEKEKKLVERCKSHLEEEKTLATFEFEDDETEARKRLSFSSTLTQIVVLNTSEDELGTPEIESVITQLEERAGKGKVLALSGRIEAEISQLPEYEAEEFLKELKIDKPAKNLLIQKSYDLLNLVSFFTVGDDEVRAWTITKGMDAQKSAGRIHTDIERGFIRAETVSFEHFISDGSMAKAKESGHFRLEGKTYLVQDGDIMNFRFNV